MSHFRPDSIRNRANSEMVILLIEDWDYVSILLYGLSEIRFENLIDPDWKVTHPYFLVSGRDWYDREQASFDIENAMKLPKPSSYGELSKAMATV